MESIHPRPFLRQELCSPVPRLPRVEPLAIHWNDPVVSLYMHSKAPRDPSVNHGVPSTRFTRYTCEYSNWLMRDEEVCLALSHDHRLQYSGRSRIGVTWMRHGKSILDPNSHSFVGLPAAGGGARDPRRVSSC